MRFLYGPDSLTERMICACGLTWFVGVYLPRRFLSGRLALLTLGFCMCVMVLFPALARRWKHTRLGSWVLREQEKPVGMVGMLIIVAIFLLPLFLPWSELYLWAR